MRFDCDQMELVAARNGIGKHARRAVVGGDAVSAMLEKEVRWRQASDKVTSHTMSLFAIVCQLLSRFKLDKDNVKWLMHVGYVVPWLCFARACWLRGFFLFWSFYIAPSRLPLTIP